MKRKMVDDSSCISPYRLDEKHYEKYSHEIVYKLIILKVEIESGGVDNAQII